MSFKYFFLNTRGEAASLILIVSMIVATLGIITGSKVVEQQIRTTTNAQSTLGVTLYPNTMNFPIPEGKYAAFRVEVWGTRAARASKIIITVGGYTHPYNVLIEGNTTRYETVAPFLYNASTGIYAINVPLMGVNGAANTYGKIEVQVDTNDGGPSANVSGQYLVTAAPTFTPVPPTATPIPPTATPIPPTATNTPVPPTPTNTPVPKIFTLNGSVKYATGQGTSGIAIKLLKYTPTSQRDLVAQTTTDANGNYQFANVAEGTYDVEPVSTSAHTVSPTVVTIPLNASPFTVTAPPFTSSGSPPATNTPIPPPATNTPEPTTPPVVLRPDVVIKSATHSFNTLGGMTLITVFENLGTAAVNYVGAHAMNVEVKDGSQVVCETTNLAGIAGLAPQTTKSHTTYFPTNIYSSCSSFTPTPGKTYNVTLYVDPPAGSSNNGLIAELDETNNTKSFNFTQPSNPAVTVPAATNTPTAIPLPLPDLIVKSSTHTFDTSANLTMVAGIQNVGKAKVNSGNHVLNVEIKDPVTSPTTVLCETVSAVDIAGLAPQAIYSHTVLFTSEIYNKCPTFSPIPGKTYKVTLYIDPPTKTDKNGTVPEAIETNNSRSFNFVQPGGSPATNTPVPPTVPPTAPPATTSTPSTTTTDVNMEITIINPQPNFMIWGTAQEMGVANKISAIKCNIGDSTKPLVTIKCPQLKRGKSYEFIALAKAKLPNAQTIQSDKNTYIIPGTSTITPQSQKKTITLPGNTQPPTLPPSTPTATTAPVQTTATPTATSTPNPDYNFEVTLPTENSQHYLPLQLEYRGSISGAASNRTAYIDLKLYKYPINTNIPLLETRISSFNSTNNSISFSGMLTGANVNTVGDYVLQLIPFGQTGTIIGNHKEVRFQIVDVPALPTATPTNTPVPGTPTPTPLRAICQDLLVSGDSAQKYDVIFLPSGYSDYNTFEADAKEAVSYYRNAVPDALNAKYNYKIFTNLEKGYDVVTCRSTTNNSTYPCWSSFLAKDSMRNCNGDAYVILTYTPKPSEDATKATQALNQFGGVKAVTLGKNRGEMLVLRYDLSQLTSIVSGSIVEGGGNSVSSLLRAVWESVLQKFR